MSIDGQPESGRPPEGGGAQFSHEQETYLSAISEDIGKIHVLEQAMFHARRIARESGHFKSPLADYYEQLISDAWLQLDDDRGSAIRHGVQDDLVDAWTQSFLAAYAGEIRKAA